MLRFRGGNGSGQYNLWISMSAASLATSFIIFHFASYIRWLAGCGCLWQEPCFFPILHDLSYSLIEIQRAI